MPSVIGVIPYVGLNFAVYETLKDSVLKYYGEPRLNPASHWTAATCLLNSYCFWH